jgi:protein translocase SecG subunit
MSTNLLSFVQIILGIVLISLILIQAKGSGLGSTFGGDLGFYSTKRGFEKILFRGTLVITFLFFIASILTLMA